MLVRFVALVAILVVPMGVDGCQAQSKAGNPKELATAAFSALRSGDFANYLKLMPTEAQMQAACPGTRKQLKEYVDNAKEGFGECREKGDWTNARLGEIKGGEAEGKGHNACPAASMARNVKFDVNFGQDSTRVKLDNPLIFKGQYLLLAPPECGP